MNNLEIFFDDINEARDIESLIGSLITEFERDLGIVVVLRDCTIKIGANNEHSEKVVGFINDLRNTLKKCESR